MQKSMPKMWKPKHQQSDTSDNNDEPQKLEAGVEQQQAEHQYPSFKVALPIVLSICLANFLCALDRTIIGVAVPAISNDFGAFDDISWYESAYLLTFAALQLPMGKVYTFFPAKWVFIVNVVVFEVGSVVSAAAPTSTAFIVGRAISGIASAGLTTGGQVIIVDIFPLKDRPKFQGFVGATFGLASIAGPLLGGVFTTKVTWRWCFWINLPIGGLALIVLLLLLPAREAPKQRTKESFLKKVQEFDPIGTALVTPGLILLLLALQWGGNDSSWTSAKVLTTLILGIALLVAFVIFEVWSGDEGIVPMKIICQRSVAAASTVSLGFGSALVIVTFYVPIWYQAIQGYSAVEAGYRMLGYFLTAVVGVIGSGIAVSKMGYYTPWLIVGTAISIIGCGLLSTLGVSSGEAAPIGYQVVVGAGIGLTLAQPINAVQTVLPREDIPIGLTINNFMNFAGGTVFISVCQTVLASSLRTEISQNLPGFDASSVLGSGATDIAKKVPQDQLPAFLEAYNQGIINVFYVALGVSCLAFIASWFVEWKTVKKPEGETEDR